MVTPRATNYTSARNEPPRVLTLQYINFSLKYISVNEILESWPLDYNAILSLCMYAYLLVGLLSARNVPKPTNHSTML